MWVYSVWSLCICVWYVCACAWMCVVCTYVGTCVLCVHLHTCMCGSKNMSGTEHEPALQPYAPHFCMDSEYLGCSNIETTHVQLVDSTMWELPMLPCGYLIPNINIHHCFCLKLWKPCLKVLSWVSEKDNQDTHMPQTHTSSAQGKMVSKKFHWKTLISRLCLSLERPMKYHDFKTHLNSACSSENFSFQYWKVMSLSTLVSNHWPTRCQLLPRCRDVTQSPGRVGL